MTPVPDLFEARAQQAGRAAHDAVRGVDMTGIAAIDAGRLHSRQPRRLVWAAAVIVLVTVVATYALARSLQPDERSLPAFRPEPLAGAVPFHAQLAPKVTFDVPAGHTLAGDTADFLLLRIDGTAGGLMAMRVRSYPYDDRADLAAAIMADDRLRVVRRHSATVGGEPATRLVLEPAPGVPQSDWFCPMGDRPCWGTTPTGGNTLYIFSHDGTRYVLSGGSNNETAARAMRPVVDGAAATWTW